MNLKSSCKTAILLAIISIVLVLAGRLLALVVFFMKSAGTQDGADEVIQNSLIFILPPSLQIAGFVTFLSGYLKRLNTPNTKAKGRRVVGTILIGLAAAAIIMQIVYFLSTSVKANTEMNFQFALRCCRYFAALLCAISLSVFAARSLSRYVTRTPAIAAVICHCLLACIMISVITNLVFSSLMFFGGRRVTLLGIIARLAPPTFNCLGTVVWLAAVLTFLFAWIKQHRKVRRQMFQNPSFLQRF